MLLLSSVYICNFSIRVTRNVYQELFRTCSVCFWGILLLIYLPQNILAQEDISNWLTSIFFSLPPSPCGECCFKTMEPLGWILSFPKSVGVMHNDGFCDFTFFSAYFCFEILCCFYLMILSHHTSSADVSHRHSLRCIRGFATFSLHSAF